MTTERPWYIGLLLGVAGWFAGLFLLVFVFAIFSPKEASSAAVIGAVLLAAAWGLYRADREGAFFSQLALAISIAGQVAMLIGLHETFFRHSHGIAPIALIALILQVALVFAMPNRLHITMSTLFACMAWAVFIRYSLWDDPFWDAPGKAKAGPSLPLALMGWAIVWLPLGVQLYSMIRRESPRRPIMNGIIVGLAFATLISQPFESFGFIFRELTDAHSGWLSLWPLLSALASLGALVAAFALGSRGLMALCIVAALLHVSHFYYAMGTTLLAKSLLMLVAGAALLAGAHYLKRGPAP